MISDSQSEHLSLAEFQSLQMDPILGWFMNRKFYKEALSLCRVLVETLTSSGQIYYLGMYHHNLGICLYHLDRKAEAVEQFIIAMTFDMQSHPHDYTEMLAYKCYKQTARELKETIPSNGPEDIINPSEN